MDKKEDLGDYLTRELNARNLTIQGLAAQAEMTYEVVRSAVRGQAAPSWENVNRMLRPLGVRLAIVPLDSATQPVEATERATSSAVTH
ncbi:hypothetical protein GO986_18815 [Deinococcus sp. HMF7620]|uniref:HTH cro/C1-type domain-containing protein n=1 Tax=Deinococcus arboris TaxID=2682977 RepID=A0A7C9I1P5_9DEIO|nr:hypothetical protein [Deinococcus arboris]MVN88795.1 hypothetical protein [Deinococcus arboris]